MTRRCPNCDKKVVGHPNKKFCRPKCKDRYHNVTNPRGFFAHLKDEPRDWEDDTHPFSSDAFEGF